MGVRLAGIKPLKHAEVRVRISYVMVFVSDMARSVAFYRDVVGLPLRFESPGWTEFETEGATLALHQSHTPRTLDDAPELPAGQCRPGFNVADLDAFHQRMVSHGVRCLDAPKVVFGSRIAQYADPDGMAFSIGEERKGR